MTISRLPKNIIWVCGPGENGVCIGALAVALYAYYSPAIGSELVVPLMNQTVDFGIWYVPFTVIAVVAIVNAVNLTDGLDGLASGG